MPQFSEEVKQTYILLDSSSSSSSPYLHIYLYVSYLRRAASCLCTGSPPRHLRRTCKRNLKGFYIMMLLRLIILEILLEKFSSMPPPLLSEFRGGGHQIIVMTMIMVIITNWCLIGLAMSLTPTTAARGK